MDNFDYFNYLKTKLEQSNTTTSIIKIVLYSAIVISIMKMLNIIL